MQRQFGDKVIPEEIGTICFEFYYIKIISRYNGYNQTRRRTSAMLNSKERIPSIMTLFASGKKQRNKSKK